MIHKDLKRFTSVAKSKRHPQELVNPKGGDDDSLLNVYRSHRDLVITLLEVEFREHRRTVNLRGEVSDVQERIIIRNSNCVQLSIITTRPPIPLLLLDHVKRRSPGRCFTRDDARLLHRGEFSLGSSQLVRVQAAGFGKNLQAREGEKMVAYLTVGQRGCKPTGRENVRKF